MYTQKLREKEYWWMNRMKFISDNDGNGGGRESPQELRYDHVNASKEEQL